ncbi:MAG: cupin domain-containing protein [Candidatus Dormibacteria bacterium]
MATAGSVIENPRRLERVTFLKTASESAGEVLEIRAEAGATPNRPPMHVHSRQTETFVVEAGRMSFSIDAREGTAGEGETIVAPAGAAHTWWNEGPDELVVRATLEPAARFETFLETIYGLTSGGRVSSNGVPNPLQAAVIFHEFRDEWVPVFLPWPVRKLVFPVLAFIGRLCGYHPWYPEFSPQGPVKLKQQQQGAYQSAQED